MKDHARKLKLLEELESELEDGEASEMEAMLPKKADVTDEADMAEESGEPTPSLREQLNEEPLYGRESDDEGEGEDDEMALMRHYSKMKG